MIVSGGINIDLAEQPKGVYLIGEHASISKLKDGSTLPSQPFIVTARGIEINVHSIDFSIEGAPYVPILPSGVTVVENVVSINPSLVTFKTLSVRASSEDATYQAVFTIIVVEDGQDGQDGQDGEKGDSPTNYLILGFWNGDFEYKLSDAGVPVVKEHDGTTLGYSPYKLIATTSTVGSSPSTTPNEWQLVESSAFMYMQDAYIEHLQATIVTAKMLRTSTEGARTEVDTSGIAIYNVLGNKNIEFGLDENGMAVMRYLDDEGNVIYDLGPTGLRTSASRAESFVQITSLTHLAEFPGDIDAVFDKTLIKNTKNATPATIYRYISKINAGVNLDPENDGRLFSAPSKDPLFRLNGVFTTIRSMNDQYRTNETGLLSLPNMHPENEPVYGGYAIFFAPVDYYSAGKSFNAASYRYYWNEGRILE